MWVCHVEPYLRLCLGFCQYSYNNKLFTSLLTLLVLTIGHTPYSETFHGKVLGDNGYNDSDKNDDNCMQKVISGLLTQLCHTPNVCESI